MALLLTLAVSVAANVISHYICRYIDDKLKR